MFHNTKRWIAQNVLNKHPSLKRIIFSMYSQYISWVTKRDAKKRLKNIKPEKYYDIESINKKNIIIIVADCMRFKNTTQADYHRDTTPFLASIGKNYRAISGAPWTYPSVPTILSGLYPTRHGAYIHSKEKLLDNLKNIKGIRANVITLPELLLYMDYDVYMATAIELSSLHFRRRIPNIRWYPGETRAENILNDFLKWVGKRRRKNFFAYLHLGDPHEPLNPPNEYWNYFGKVKNLKNVRTWAYIKPEEWNKPGFKKYVENRILLYDNTLRYVNDQIERFFRELEKMKLLEETLIVITADHGEEFWEHREIEAKNFYDPRGAYGFGHGHNVFREIIEVPLTMDGFSELRNWEQVSLADITPTILRELNVKPKFSLDGMPLQEKPKKRAILTEAVGYGYEKKALQVGEFKFLYAKDDNIKWVFNLKKDPEEIRPIKDESVIRFFEDKLKRVIMRQLSKNLK